MEKQKYHSTIGYFGDSFCADTSKDSWITILAEKLSANIVNTGKPGSSMWTAILDFERLKNQATLPDVCIFCWTNPHRLYHPKRYLNLRNLPKDSNLADAVKKYFGYLWFNDKEFLNYKYVLQYFDQNEISKIKGIKYQIFSINPNDANNDFEVSLQNNFIDEFSLLNFSGLTLEDHGLPDLGGKLINHMSIDKNKELANYFYKKIEGNSNEGI